MTCIRLQVLTILRIINGVAFTGTLFFYFPKNHHHDLVKSHILKKIDYVGAVLSIVGLTLLYAPIHSHYRKTELTI